MKVAQSTWLLKHLKNVIGSKKACEGYCLWNEIWNHERTIKKDCYHPFLLKDSIKEGGAKLEQNDFFTLQNHMKRN